MSISRRTVVQGAAWSVPVIALAPAAQAYQVSPNDITIGIQSGTGHKCPGKSEEFIKGYYFTFYVETSGPLENSVPKELSTLTLSMADGGVAPTVVGVEVGTTYYKNGAEDASVGINLSGQSATTIPVTVFISGSGASANGTVVFDISLTYLTTQGERTITGTYTVHPFDVVHGGYCDVAWDATA